MKFLRRALFTFFLLSSTLHAASELSVYLSSLPYVPVSTLGRFCEKITELGLMAEYEDDPTVTILTNVTYTNSTKRRGQVLGEADILILRDGYLWKFYEVKCSNKKNMRKAAKKAALQIERFSKNCIDNKCLMFQGRKQISVKIPRDSEVELYAVSYKDAHPSFAEFELTWDELNTLYNEVRRRVYSR